MSKKTDKLREMNLQELDREEKELRDQIWKQRLQLATGQLDNPQKVRESRRGLARVLTLKREMELAEAGTVKR